MSATGTILKFAAFEIDTATGELRKHGLRIRLSEQPFRVLVSLAEKPGELVSRDELRQLIWPSEAFGDFEQGINRAVNKVREALGDSAANPRFIETVPGRGYRFIGIVHPQEQVEAPRQNRRAPLIIVAGALVALLGLLVKAFAPAPLPELKWRKLTTDNYHKIEPALTDGTRVFFLAGYGGEQFVAQIPIEGGQPARLPVTLPGPFTRLQDISIDGEEFLLTAASDNRREPKPLWRLRIADGAARRLGSINATSAAYSADGKSIAYSAANKLWVADSEGASTQSLLDLPDSSIPSVYWSADGRHLRFSRQDRMSAQLSAWEIGRDGSGLRRLVPSWNVSGYSPAGGTPDGKLDLFGAEGNLWGSRSGFFSASVPVKLTEDDPEFSPLIRARGNDAFFAIGVDRLGELQKLDMRTRRWMPVLEGISAEAVEYSRDGTRVAYVTYPQRILWIRDASGARPIQLTSRPMIASFPRWSPDGRQLAFTGQEAPNKPVRLYLIDVDSGTQRPAVPGASGSQADPSWSPDGKQLLYSLLGRGETQEPPYLRLADIQTGKVFKLPGSENTFSPRWSPDGRMIAALDWSDRSLKLYDVEANRWEKIADRSSWPTWTPDGKAILFVQNGRVMKLGLRKRLPEVLTELRNEENGGFWQWMGVASDGAPLRMRDRDSRQIYELKFDQR